MNQKLTIYHANMKNTGCALSLEMKPDTQTSDGRIVATFAPQRTCATAQPRTFPTFDWENALVVHLMFDDICKMLQVFRGELESLEDGKGLFHHSPKHATLIQMRHLIDYVCGYEIEITQKMRETDEERKAKIVLAPHEALGICEAITASMSKICFGI